MFQDLTCSRAATSFRLCGTYRAAGCSDQDQPMCLHLCHDHETTKETDAAKKNTSRLPNTRKAEPLKTEDYYKLNKLHRQSKARAAGKISYCPLQERTGHQLRSSTSTLEKDYQLPRSVQCPYTLRISSNSIP
jgi:hypothetical protein